MAILIELVGLPVCVGLIGLLVSFANNGSEGMQQLRSKAEKTGDLKKLERLTRRGFLILHGVTILLMGAFFIGGISILAANGKQGVGMDFLRSYGPALTLGLLGALLLLVVSARLITRMEMEEDPADHPAEFWIRCLKNPTRLNNLMLGLIFLLLLFFLPVALIWSPYVSDGAGWFLLIVLLLAVAWCVSEVVKVSRDLCTLMLISSQGIRSCRGPYQGRMIPWSAVLDVRVEDNFVILELRPEAGPDLPDKVCFSLKGMHYSADTIRYMISSVRPAADK